MKYLMLIWETPCGSRVKFCSAHFLFYVIFSIFMIHMCDLSRGKTSDSVGNERGLGSKKRILDTQAIILARNEPRHICMNPIFRSRNAWPPNLKLNMIVPLGMLNVHQNRNWYHSDFCEGVTSHALKRAKHSCEGLATKQYIPS